MKRIVLFSVWTFLFSWAAWAPVVLANLHTTETVPGAVLFFIGGFGPSVVGTVFLLRSPDAGGLRELLSRTFSFSRIPAGPLMLAVLVYPALFLLSSLVYVATGGAWPEFAGFAGMVESIPAFVGGVLLTFFLGPFSEEIGWRGFALPRVQRQYGPLCSSLVVGVIWWAWHIPLFFTWLYNQTRQSIWIAIIAHFVINMVISGSSPFDGTVFAILSFVLLAAVGVLVWVRPRLGYAGE